MAIKTKIRRVDLPVAEQLKLAVIFAKDPSKPLAQSSVANYLNQTRYPQKRYEEIRKFAVEKLGGVWITETKVIRDK